MLYILKPKVLEFVCNLEFIIWCLSGTIPLLSALGYHSAGHLPRVKQYMPSYHHEDTVLTSS